MPANVKDIITAMEDISPSFMAEHWDNIGLQIGDEKWPVSEVWIALDPLLEVVKEASNNNADILITHHPFFYKPLSSLNLNTTTGQIIDISLKNRMAIYSAHTNLDKAPGGINDILASMIKLKDVEILSKETNSNYYKLIFYVPVDHEGIILKQLFETKAGNIGKYSCCSFRTTGKGTFQPGIDSKPFIGEQDKLTEVNEVRIETIVNKKDITNVIDKLRTIHPYEEMAFDVFPLISEVNNYGLGRVGNLTEETTQKDILMLIKKNIGNPVLRMIGNPDLKVSRVALCSGSGASLLKNFYASGAQVFVTGDIKYHEARFIEERGLGCIDMGHFASEHIIIKSLLNSLQDKLKSMNLKVNITPYLNERDPFNYI